jgi:hypothetical protein
MGKNWVQVEMDLEHHRRWGSFEYLACLPQVAGQTHFIYSAGYIRTGRCALYIPLVIETEKLSQTLKRNRSMLGFADRHR